MRGKCILSLILALALALSFVPAVSAAPATLSQVVVNMDDSGLVIGSYPDHPGVTVSPEKVHFNWGSCYWIRSGGEDYIGNSKLIEEGTYRFSFSMYFSKKDYTPAPEGVKVILNGAEVSAKVDTEPDSSGNYYIDFESPERKAATLPPISGTAKVEPSELKVGMTVDCVVTGGPSADKLRYQWEYKESADGEVRNAGSTQDVNTVHLYSAVAGYTMRCRVSAEGYSGYLYTPWRYVSAEEYVPEPHSVTVEGGTADVSEAKAGDTVTVRADGKPAHKFVRWEVVSGNAALLDPKAAETSFTMPDGAVALRAVYELAPETVSEFYVYVTPPAAGEKPQAPTVKSDEYYVKDFSWAYLKGDEFGTLTEADVFEPGVFYQCRADLALKDKQTGDPATLKGYINDDPAPGGYDVILARNTFDAIRVVGSFVCPDAEQKPEKKENPFVDVSEADSFYDAVLWAYYTEPQVTNGMDATHFGPNLTVTRGQAVTFLWRASGCPEPENPGAASRFTDLTQDYYKKAVAWAVETGVTNGVDETHFDPEGTLTTAHIVTFLYRTLNPGRDGWYETARDWAAEHGVTGGLDITVDNTVFCPRSLVAGLLYRMFD
jgi:hypothetical protein